MSVVETAKKLEKSEFGVVNDHGEMKVFTARNEGEDQTLLNKAAKIVLKRARYKLK